MSVVLVVVCVLILVGGGAYLWTKRPRKLKGVSRADLEAGRIPDAFRDALRDMQQRVSDRVTKYYTTENRSSRFSLSVGQRYGYPESFEDLVDRIEVVDHMDGNARGGMQRRFKIGGGRGDGGNYEDVLVLYAPQLDDVGHLQHELLHSEQWRHEELMGPKGNDTVDADYPAFDRWHWPVIFSELIGS